MKKIYIKGLFLLAVATFSLCVACSGNDNEVLEQVIQQTADKNMTRTDLVEATVAIDASTSLQTALEAALPGAATTVQRLTISGDFYATDAIYMKNLKSLKELDMSAVNIKESYADWMNGGNYETFWLGENSIGEQMFQNASALVSIILPSSLTQIGHESFAFCPSLESIEIPATVTFIGGYAFRENISLKSAKILTSMTELSGSIFYGCFDLEHVELSPTITKLSSGTFEGCSSLKDFTPFTNVTTIGWAAFSGCGFTSLDLSHVVELEGRAFSDCRSLESVVLPNHLTRIESGTFYNCLALRNINMPTSLQGIGYDAFGFTQLTSVVIPDGVTVIEHQTFYNCQSLNSVVLPKNLEFIGYYAFFGSAITSIEIPSTVTTIEYDAFRETNLKVLTIPPSVTTTNGSIVNFCSDLEALIWQSPAEVYGRTYDMPNCFLYLEGDGVNAKHTGYADEWKNVVKDGVADSIRLEFNWEQNRNYSCYRPYTAKKISYEYPCYNTIYTEQGQSVGWRPITLPFTPTKITTEKNGEIAPFNSGIAGAKPFWLRELTANGFADVTTMKPNVPYIMAFPYNPNIYLPEYNIDGTVTFSAENVQIAATAGVTYPAVDGPGYSLHPTYNFVEKGTKVYALNYNYGVDDYYLGSIFARSSTDVYPFEAYVTTNSNVAALSISGINTASVNTRSATEKNTTGIPAIGDM